MTDRVSRRRGLLIAAWSAVVAVLVVDPQAAMGVALRGIAAGSRLTRVLRRTK